MGDYRGGGEIDLERVRRSAPAEESPLRPFRSLIILIILAAIALFVIYQMGQAMVRQGADVGEARPAAPVPTMAVGPGA